MHHQSLILVTLLALSQAYLSPEQFRTNFPYPTRKPIPELVRPPVEDQCCQDNTIKVSGSASLEVEPDIAYISATLEAKGRSAEDAVSSLSSKVKKILEILKSNGIPKDSYETTSLQVYPDVSYVDGKRIENGQIASQSLKITLENIDQSGQKIAQIIDSLATVNGIILSGLSFDLSDKTSAFSKARKSAFEDALTKAEDLSLMLEISLGKLVTLTDSQGVAPVVQSQEKMLSGGVGMNDMVAVPTEINVGSIPISYSLQAVYAFQ